MNPNMNTNPFNTSSLPVGTDPRVLLQLLFQQIADNSVNGYELLSANAIAGFETAWRVVFRSLAVDVASGQWGTPIWGQDGQQELSSENGTASLQSVLFFMARNTGSSANPSGKFEVQIKVNGQWYSAASLLKGQPMIPNMIPGVPQIYMPGPSITIFSFQIYATTAQAPQYAVPTTPINVNNPVGDPIAGFTNGYHNVGGPAWSTNYEKDPTGQYTLENPSPLYSDWSKMVWVKK